MESTTELHCLRGVVAAFMQELPIPEATPTGVPAVVRADGVNEFYKNWRVRGDGDTGLFATYSDHDDLIEFGLTVRQGADVTNVLTASMVLDDDQRGELNVSSESKEDLNFDAVVTPDKTGVLLAVLSYFRQVLVAV